MEWSDAAIAIARKLFKDGVSAADAAEELGTTRNAVLGKWFRLGLKRGPRAGKTGRPRQVRPEQTTTLANRWARRSHKRRPFTDSPEPVFGLRVSLEDLEDGMCRWPIGTPLKSGFGFCGLTAHGDKPYCIDHCMRAYVAHDPDADSAPVVEKTFFRRAG